MPVVQLDDCGRLTLPDEIRDRYGDHYHIVPLHNSVKLIPIDDDPLEALRAEFADVEQSATELRENARTSTLEQTDR